MPEAVGAPLVAVVVSVYNKASFIAETLASVRAQTHPAIHLVVVDDGSTDDSLAVVRGALEGTSATVVETPNGGVSRARTLGFEHADPAARYVLFLDADDLLAPDAVARLVAHLEAHPSALACYTTVRFVGPDGTPEPDPPSQTRWVPTWYGRRAVPDGDPVTPLASVCSRFWAIPSSLLFRADAFRLVGPWDSGLCRPAVPFHAEDKDMAMRLALAGELHRMDAALLDYRVLPSGHKDALYAGLKALDLKWWTADVSAADRRRLRAGIRFDARVTLLDNAGALGRGVRARRPGPAARAAVETARSAVRWATVWPRLERAARRARGRSA